jgi:hypothetical protein
VLDRLDVVELCRPLDEVDGPAAVDALAATVDRLASPRRFPFDAGDLAGPSPAPFATPIRPSA